MFCFSESCDDYTFLSPRGSRVRVEAGRGGVRYKYVAEYYIFVGRRTLAP